MKPEPGDVILTLRPLKSAVPVGVRVRAALKYCLRAVELRCVDAREIPAEAPAEVGLAEANAEAPGG